MSLKEPLREPMMVCSGKLSPDKLSEESLKSPLKQELSKESLDSPINGGSLVIPLKPDHFETLLNGKPPESISKQECVKEVKKVKEVKEELCIDQAKEEVPKKSFLKEK